MPPMPLTTRIAKTLLDRETDARFWAQTGYKVGHKLDPHNPADRAMTKVWLDVFAKVKRENDRGTLVLTYNKPGVEQHLADAQAAQGAALDHVEAAAASPDPTAATLHATAAQQAQDAATASAQTAAAMQPPSVSPELAHAAGTEAAEATGTAPPPPLDLSHDHPANRDQGRPEHPIEFYLAMDAQTGAASGAGAVPPTTAADHLSLAQARAAAQHAANVHEITARPELAAASQQSSIDPQTVAQIRDEAKRHALTSTTPYPGVVLTLDGSWVVEPLPSREALDGWYGTITDHPDRFRYAAMFDNPVPGVEAANELFGSGQAIPVNVTVDRPPSDPPPPAQPPPMLPPSMPQQSSNGGAFAALAAVALAGGATVFAGRGRRASRSRGRGRL
jgi:hypothetical protein